MQDPDSPQLLIAVANELEAGTILSALSARGLDARMTGELTSGFRAESPGMVRVMVRHKDLARAQELLQEISLEAEDIDWSQVDVGDPLDD